MQVTCNSENKLNATTLQSAVQHMPNQSVLEAGNNTSVYLLSLAVQHNATDKLHMHGNHNNHNIMKHWQHCPAGWYYTAGEEIVQHAISTE